MGSEWAKRHALAAPWGTALITWLLTIYYAPTNFASMVSLGAVIYGMIASALEMGAMMAFYAYEKIKNERAKRRKQIEYMQRESRREGRAEGRTEGVTETIDAIRAKFKEDPNLSPEELLEGLMADLQNNGRNNGNRGD